MLDIGVTEWNEQTKQKQKTDENGRPFGKTLAQLAMEYAKFARQRAETGARLRVVKELTGMPTAFSPAEAAKPLLFARVVQNTDYLLKTPEGRLLAAAQATGTQDVIAALYGKQALPGTGGEALPEPRNVTEGEGGDGPPPAGRNLAAEAAGDDPEPRQQPAQSEFDQLTVALEEFQEGYAEQLNQNLPSGNPYLMIRDELANLAATVETRRALLGRIRAFLKRLEERV
jgi:hypothetical protein